MVKESICNAGDRDIGSIPGRSPGRGNDSALQYSCLENPKDRGSRRATSHRVAQLVMTEMAEHTHTSPCYCQLQALCYIADLQNLPCVVETLCPLTILTFDLISLFLQVLQTTVLLSFYEFGYLDSICK